MTGKYWHKNHPFTLAISTHFNPKSKISRDRNEKNIRIKSIAAINQGEGTNMEKKQLIEREKWWQ